MADDIKKEPVGATVVVVFNPQTANEIARFINFIDEGANLPTAEAPMQAIRDYATKPAYTERDGKLVKVRGPLANSLGEYLQQVVRIGKLRWDSVIDDRTADLDASLDGKVFDANDPAAPIPPLHPNCRCQRVPVPDNPRAYA